MTPSLLLLAIGQWTAELSYDPAKPEAASVTARIQAATIATGITIDVEAIKR